MANTETGDGLYIWDAANLVSATQALNGQWHQHEDKDIKTTRIISDTRKIEAGDIFLAIVGDNFDGHNFINDALEKGAIAAIVSYVKPEVNIPQLKVDDTRIAFGHIASYRRQQHNDLKVIGITGSSGKTTVKEMLRSIFKQNELVDHNSSESNKENSDNSEITSTLVTRGNLNNDYGVPMMLLELSSYHRYAVLELGANHVGEIAYTANIVKPDVACILNIGTAHLGEFGGRDNIAKTKAEIYQALSAESVAVVPYDDDYTDFLTQEAKQYTANVMHYGCQSETEVNPKLSVYASDIDSTATHCTFTLHVSSSIMQAYNPSDDVSASSLQVHLPMAGRHNISNALAAAACALAVGIELETIVSGLNQSKSIKGRLGRQALGRHQIIDDTYNANPNSVRAAGDVLAAQQGNKILVLGDIGELGDAAQSEHYKLGADISNKHLDMLLCVGEFAADTVAGAKSNNMKAAHAFDSKADLLKYLTDVLLIQTPNSESCTILFKGSRSATMETLIEDLVKNIAKFE